MNNSNSVWDQIIKKGRETSYHSDGVNTHVSNLEELKSCIKSIHSISPLFLSFDCKEDPQLGYLVNAHFYYNGLISTRYVGFIAELEGIIANEL